MATWTEDVIQAMQNLGGQVHYSTLYEEVKRIRTEPLPESWQEQIRRAIQIHSSDSTSFADGADLFYAAEGLGNGVWALRDYVPEATPLAADAELASTVAGASRVVAHVYRILRDTAMARSLKIIHKNRCQLCGQTLTIGHDKPYSEVHHIQPLGRPHNGPDSPLNILVLCPNDHVRCDYGGLRLAAGEIETTPEHPVGQVFIDYHNVHIYQE